MDLSSLLGEAAARHSEKTALIGERSAMSYREVTLKAQAVAHDLHAFGAEPGSRIALHVRNGTAIAVCYFACFYAGMIAVPINTRMKAPEIDYVLEHTGRRFISGKTNYFERSTEFHRASRGCACSSWTPTTSSPAAQAHPQFLRRQSFPNSPRLSFTLRVQRLTRKGLSTRISRCCTPHKTSASMSMTS